MKIIDACLLFGSFHSCSDLLYREEKGMKTLIVEKDGALHIGEIPVPEIDETSALVKVLASGICGTDKKILHGTFKGFDSYPCLLGHEAVGEVVKIGSKVKYLKVGDKVITPYVDKGPGKYTTIFGAFSEYTVVHDWKAMDELGIGRGTPGFVDYYQIQKKIPSNFDNASGVMLITLREVLAATRHFDFKADKSIVIFGAGIIANRAIAYFGKERIECIIDNSKDRIGTKLQGIDIVSLDGYINDMSSDRDSQIVIAVGSNYVSTIAEQLKNNGISEFCWFKVIENCVEETI